jgi:hypothetical protein
MGKSDAQRAREYRDRKKLREEEAKVAEINSFKTRDAWFQFNRAKLSETELQELKARHERVLDLIEWIESGHLVDVTDELYISPLESVEIVLADVREHGAVRFSGIFHDQSLGPDVFDTPWEHNTAPPYWQTKVLDKLVAEGPQTAQYARTGYLTALPDGLVCQYLQQHGFPFEKAVEVVGWRCDNNVVSVR